MGEFQINEKSRILIFKERRNIFQNLGKIWLHFSEPKTMVVKD